MLIQLIKMMGRTVSFTQIQSMRDCHGDVILRFGNAVLYGISQCQVGGNGGGQSAAGSMGIFCGNTLDGEGEEVGSVKQQVGGFGIFIEMPAF